MDFATSITQAETTAMNEKAPYPRLAQLLIQRGVRHYIVDTATGTITYYGESEHTRDGTAANSVGSSFDAGAVIAALRAIQAGETGYPAFLAAIAAAGVQTYISDLENHRVIYIGHGHRYEESYA